MKRVCLIILIIGFAVGLYGEKIGTLNNVLKPDMIDVYGNELYVVEESTIFIFSLKDLSLVRKFGQKGEGPGELKFLPFLPNTVSASQEQIFVDSPDKILYFSREGKLISEKRKTGLVFQLSPVGKNYVAKKGLQGDDKLGYTAICVYGPDLKEIKELSRQKSPQQNREVDLVPDSLNFCVSDEKIFLERSTEGFLIEVFDSMGNKLYQIENKNYQKIPFNDQIKEQYFEFLKNDPLAKLQGWENIKATITFHFPGYMPAIKDLLTANGKIYIQTFLEKNGKSEFIIMDLKGKILQSILLPKPISTSYLGLMIGRAVRFFSFQNEVYYYLVENEEEETYEVHAQSLK